MTDFEALEVLLLLVRAPATSWTVQAAADALRMPAEQLARPMAELCQHGLVAHDDADGSFRFAPTAPALRADCEELRRLYDEDRFEIIGLMGHLAVERMRRSAAAAFAGAFRIRKPPKGGDSDA